MSNDRPKRLGAGTRQVNSNARKDSLMVDGREYENIVRRITPEGRNVLMDVQQGLTEIELSAIASS